MNNNGKTHSYIIEIEGIVQGVGFRPFIYKLAKKYGVKGTVANTTEGVVIKTAGLSDEDIKAFTSSIAREKPPASVIESIRTSRSASSRDYSDFSIEKSRDTGNRFQLVSPDIATCQRCIDDILDSSDLRRYKYPFTNCTNCGPRFTIIRQMPYDRPNTTMDRFDMCPDCRKEYSDPYDRRFHAQPNACRKCGPQLKLTDRIGGIIESHDPIKAASALLSKGYLIGLKSLGGFQIACDALSDRAVMELRSRKSRPSKPFAVMTGDLEWIQRYYDINQAETESLKSSKAPIVLLRKKNADYPLSAQISPYNKYEGIMLPYTPMHHILFQYIKTPLVMTSGNISEEPIASENDEARKRLGDICDYYLIHNRDIYARYDDSVIRIFRDREMVVRRARGYAPYPVKLGIDMGRKSILATGAQEKNTFTILTRHYGITSQHIGDLDTAQSVEFFESSLDNYKKIFGISGFNLIAHDKHPDYRSTRIAESIDDNKEALFPVQHHKAHIASVIAENKLDEAVLGFSWDGTGYGDDGKVWGSEIFTTGSSLDFERIGHLREKVLPGGDITIGRPYRMTAVYLYHIFEEYMKGKGDPITFIRDNMAYPDMERQELDILYGQIKTGFNSPLTTSMGRFFDAVSSLLGLVHIISYEGEAAISLEMSIDDRYDLGPEKDHIKAIKSKNRYETRVTGGDGLYLIDDIYIFRQVLDDLRSENDKGLISFKFHNTLAQLVIDIAIMHRKSTGNGIIALSGGVFQNKYLLDMCYTLLCNNGFDVYTNMAVPVNDGGISLGQAYMAAVKKIKQGEHKDVPGNTS